jgi:NAD(P)-dependent dehydrogenase (short-subunit alcohol dehydrogenase family)
VATTAKQVALVTGGSRGIGLGIATHLADAGFDLVIFGRRPATAVEPALEGLRKRGARVCYCQGDVCDASARQATVDAAKRNFGRLDVLVNNAGIAPPARTDILQASEKSFELVMQTNLHGPYFLTQLVANELIRVATGDGSRRGVIVNISSISSTTPSVDRGEYCISKAGVAMMTRLWAARLAEFGIHVYEVRPGLIRTDMTAAVTEKYDKLIAQGLILEARWGTPEDVGRAVTCLARGDLTYMTGHVLHVDGGLTLNRL